jgi:hypothetical protein
MATIPFKILTSVTCEGVALLTVEASNAQEAAQMIWDGDFSWADVSYFTPNPGHVDCSTIWAGEGHHYTKEDIIKDLDDVRGHTDEMCLFKMRRMMEHKDLDATKQHEISTHFVH